MENQHDKESKIRIETIESLVRQCFLDDKTASYLFMLIATNKIAHVKLEY